MAGSSTNDFAACTEKGPETFVNLAARGKVKGSWHEQELRLVSQVLSDSWLPA